MTKRKLTAIFAAFSLLLSPAPSVPAEEAEAVERPETLELVDNGDFETTVKQTTEDGTEYLWPAGGWTLTGSHSKDIGKDYAISDKYAHSGKYSLMLAGGRDSNTTRPVYPLKNLTPGAVYELTAWVLTDEPMSLSGTYMESRKQSAGGDTLNMSSEHVMDSGKEWVQISTRFTGPDDGSTHIWLYKYSPTGAAYYDDISVKLVDDLAINGSFEVAMHGRDYPQLWREGAISTRQAYDGTHSMEVKTGSTASMVRNFSAKNYMKPGNTYTASVMAYSGSKSEAAMIVDYLDADRKSIDKTEHTFETKAKDWTEAKFDFTVPEGTAHITLSLKAGKAITYFDSLSITNDTVKGLKEDAIDNYMTVLESAKLVVKPPVEGTGELVTNGDFETLNEEGDGPAGFSAYGGGWGAKTAFFSQKDPHSGKYCVELNGDGSPWAMYEVPVIGGAEYQVTAWVKRVSSSNDKGPYVKYEFYEAEGQGVLQQDSQSFISGTEQNTWSQVASRQIAHETAVSLKVYFRISGSGEAYYDDVSITMTAMPDMFKLSTDEIFYYTGDVGRATAVVTETVHEIVPGDVFDFAILDGETVLAEHRGMAAEYTTTYVFDADVLPEKGKKYTLRATLRGADGTEVGTMEEAIYRYDRPTGINENGEILYKGEPFTPVIPYHTAPFAE